MGTFTDTTHYTDSDAQETAAGTVTVNGTGLNANNTSDIVGIIFDGHCTIPKNSTINSAVITLNFSSGSFDDPDVDIYGLGVGAVTPFTTGANNISARARTTAVVTWTTTNVGTGNEDTPDLKTLVQELVNDSLWTYGQNIGFVFLARSNSSNFRVNAFDNGSNYPTISINYTLPDSGTVTLEPTADTHEHVSTGAINTSYSSANIATSDVNTRYAAFFPNLQIPAGSTIDHAYFKVWPVSYDDPGLTIAADDTATPAALSATSYDISSRTKTTAVVAWSASNVGTGAFVASPDIASVIQELVDLGGWTEEVSDIVLILQDDGTSDWIRFDTLDGTHHPYLEVTYSTPSGPIEQSVAGVLSSTGTVVKRTATPKAGTLTSAGTVKRRAGKTLAGVLTSAGAAVKRAGKPVSGVLTSAGAVTRLRGKALAGVLTSAGVVVKRSTRSLAGTLTSAGTAVKRTGKAVGGQWSAAGVLTRRTGKVVSGQLTAAGNVGRGFLKTLGGVLSSSGAVSYARVKLLSLAGALAPSGSLVRRTAVGRGGVLTAAGSVAKQTGKVVSGQWTAAGTLAKQAGKVVGGSLVAAGSVGRSVSKSLAGVLTSAGAVARGMTVTIAGVLDTSGELTRQTRKVVSGQLSATGDLTRQILKSLAGVLSSTGTALGAYFSGGFVPGLVHLTVRARGFALTARVRRFALTVRSKVQN